MKELELGGQTYRIGKLDAFKQFHVSRKIAPIIPTLIPIFVRISQDATLTDNLVDMAELLTPFAEGVASMSDESSEYVLATCLSVVQRKTGKAYAPVFSNGVAMFDDMDVGVMIQLSVQVIQDNLGSFIAGLLTSQQPNATE